MLKWDPTSTDYAISVHPSVKYLNSEVDPWSNVVQGTQEAIESYQTQLKEGKIALEEKRKQKEAVIKAIEMKLAATPLPPVQPPPPPPPPAPLVAPPPVQPPSAAPIVAQPVQPPPAAPIVAPPVQPPPAAPIVAPPVQPPPAAPIVAPPAPSVQPPPLQQIDGVLTTGAVSRSLPQTSVKPSSSSNGEIHDINEHQRADIVKEEIKYVVEDPMNVEDPLYKLTLKSQIIHKSFTATPFLKQHCISLDSEKKRGAFVYHTGTTSSGVQWKLFGLATRTMGTPIYARNTVLGRVPLWFEKLLHDDPNNNITQALSEACRITDKEIQKREHEEKPYLRLSHASAAFIVHVGQQEIIQCSVGNMYILRQPATLNEKVAILNGTTDSNKIFGVKPNLNGKQILVQPQIRTFTLRDFYSVNAMVDHITYNKHSNDLIAKLKQLPRTECKQSGKIGLCQELVPKNIDEFTDVLAIITEPCLMGE